MKKILTILLAGASTFSFAQKKSCLSRNIDDDGKTLSIHISGTIDGKDINFDRTFDVAEMSDSERLKFRDEILKEVTGARLPDPPKPPKPAVSVHADLSSVPSVPEPPAGAGVFYSSGDPEDRMNQDSDGHNKAFKGLIGGGFRKHVKYNSATGELFLQYHFKKNDEEFVYEKTVNAADKSESERQSIIDKFEREIELPRNDVEM